MIGLGREGVKGMVLLTLLAIGSVLRAGEGAPRSPIFLVDAGVLDLGWGGSMATSSFGIDAICKAKERC